MSSEWPSTPASHEHDLPDSTGLAQQRLLTAVAQASATETPATLLGEPGSGRTFLARAIHRASAWGVGQFVPVECDKTPDIPSITSVIRSRGTLLLKEVGDLGPQEQATLAMVLSHDAFRPGDQGAHARIRLLATTTASLDTLVARHRFRADLCHRLNVMTIAVVPLRDRRDEIASLVTQFLRRFAIVHRKRVGRVSTEAMALLAAHSWPGNVRELSEAMEHAVISCDGAIVDAHDLPVTVSRHAGTMESNSLEEAVNAYERDLIQDALRSTRGSRAKAARLLKTTYRVLHYKTRKYGIDYRRFKA